MKLFDFFKLNSIRNRMLSGFLFLTLIILLIGIVSTSVFNEVNKITDTDKNINQLQVLVLNLIKADNDFFDFESTNEKYFETNKSRFLVLHDSLQMLVVKRMHTAISQTRDEEYPFLGTLYRIDTLFNKYNSKFFDLERLVRMRGFKDYGLEGEMRLHAHALEIPSLKQEVLSLRRCEKDFLLRHDTVYYENFVQLSTAMMLKLKKNPVANTESIAHLAHYVRIFGERVEIEKELGLNSNSGIRSELNQFATDFGGLFSSLNGQSNELYYMLKRKAAFFYTSMIAGAVLFSILSGLWISKKLSEPIARLSKMADSAVPGLAEGGMLTLSNAADEINLLTNAYVNLINQVNEHVREIEDKSSLLKHHNEELDKLNKELDNFLYSTAHDLRSPLASLSGLVRLMKIENRQEGLYIYLDLMQRSIDRQEGFISQIVNYSRNKKVEVLPEELDLKEMIENVFQDNEFVEGGSQIEKYVYHKTDAPFYSDHNRVQVIFNNLISNGIRYYDSKKSDSYIQIKIHTTVDEASIEYLDNGIGIAPDHIQKIFDMFYRANIESKGSGLGLFILKETVGKLGGSVEVQSELNVGTRFYIRLKNLQTEALVEGTSPAHAFYL